METPPRMRFRLLLLFRELAGKRLWRGLIIGGVALLALVGFLTLRPAPPVVPVPPNLERLDAQLRDYLSEQIESARSHPRSPARHATLGLVYAVNGLWKEALQAFQNVASLQPNDPLPVMYVGVALQELGEESSALASFVKLTSTFPEFAPGYDRLGTLLLRQAKWSESAEAFSRLIQLAPQDWHGFAGLGDTRLRQGKPAEAVELLEKAIRLDSAAKTAHHLLGEAYRALGRSEDAAIELQLGRNSVNYPMMDAWSREAPAHMKLLQDQVQLANELCDAGEARRAVEILAKAWIFHPDNSSLGNQLAIALNRSNQPNKAHKVLQQVLDRDPNSVPSLITLSLVQRKLDMNDLAVRTAERAIALAPKLAQPHVAGANALLGLERDEDALASLRAASCLDPQNPDILVELGDVLWRNLDRKAEARQQFEEARKIDPASAPACARLAELNLQMGDADAARRALDLLRRVAPHSPDAALLEARLPGKPGR